MKRGVILYPLCILKRERHLENGSKLWEIKYARNTFGSITTFFFDTILHMTLKWTFDSLCGIFSTWARVFLTQVCLCVSEYARACLRRLSSASPPPLLTFPLTAALLARKEACTSSACLRVKRKEKKKSIWRLTRGQSVTARLDRHSRFNDDVRPWEFNIIFFCKWSQWAAENGLFGFIYTSWLVKARLPPLMPGHLFGLPALTCFWLHIQPLLKQRLSLGTWREAHYTENMTRLHKSTGLLGRIKETNPFSGLHI